MTSVLEKPRSDRHSFGLWDLLQMRRDPLKYFTKLMNDTGAYTWLHINGRRVVMLNDATGIEHVLQGNSSNYFKGYFQRSMRPVFGESMLLQEGTIWKERRQDVAPVFANKNFDDIIGQVVNAVEFMFKRWDEKVAKGELIDVTVEMTRFTLDAFLRALFHEARSDVADEMRSSLGIMLRDIEGRLWSLLQIPKFVAYNMPRYKRAKAFMKTIVSQLIETRRTSHAYPEDLLSKLIDGFASSPREQKILFDEVQAYVLAGHETTAHGLAWALYSLSLHPLIQRRVEQEVSVALENRPPTMENLKHLPYTRQVLDEVFRLFPPVWTMSREAIFDDKIPLDEGDYIPISPGDSVMMCHYAVHRREKYWPNPEAFDPDRFAPEFVGQRPKFAWFPFGGGPRLCLGFRFAQVESLVALAMINQRYRFSLVSGQNVAPEPIITLRPREAILFRVHKRADYKPPSAHEALMVSPSAELVVKSQSACPFH